VNSKLHVTQLKSDVAMYGGKGKSWLEGKGGVQLEGGRFSVDFDWTNMRRREGVCFRCGCSDVVLQICPRRSSVRF
jgi:hypothetical protein